MKRTLIIVVSVIAVVSLVFGASIAMAAKPQNSGSGKDVIALSNGFPSGQHFNLNIHGKQAGFSCGEDSGGHSVFTLEYCPPDETTGEPTQHIQYVSNKKASVTELTVLDKCTEAFDTTPAKVQLPYKVMVNDTLTPAGGYYVFGRILAKPNNGNIEPTSNIILYPNDVVEACNDTDPENPLFPEYTECPEDSLLALGLIVGENVYGATPEEYVRFDPMATGGKGKSKATDITRLFIYTGWVVDAALDANEDGSIDINDVPVADYGTAIPGENRDYNNDGIVGEADVEAWLTDLAALNTPQAWYFANEWIFNIADLVITEQGLVNDGTKLVQIRFYPVVTTTFGSHIIVEKQAPADTVGTAFEFDPGYYGDNFSLRHNESKDSGALEAGTYTVTEILPDGWDLDYIDFVDLDTSTPNSIDGETATITLAPGETVRVIFHNVLE
jgi:hypothetical protein